MLSEDLDGGWSCIWLLPDDLVGRGAADSLVDLLELQLDSVRVPPPEVRKTNGQHVGARVAGAADDTLPAWAHSTSGVFDWNESIDTAPVTTVESTSSVAERLLLAFKDPSDEVGDPLAVLTSSDWLRRKVVVVRAWAEHDADDVASVFTRLTASSKEHGVPPEDRTRVLVAARPSDLPSRLLDKVDPVTTRVHWWWSACDRLDTAVVTAATRPRVAPRGHSHRIDVRELVAVEVIVEVAGPDLLLAEGLASSWDGRRSTLRERIAAFAHAQDDLAPDAARRRRGGGGRPAEELRPAWNAGALELWDGQLRISPAVRGAIGSAVDLDNLVWRGQNRALMPLVDSWRARLEQTVRSRASTAILAELGREFRSGAPGVEEGGGRVTLELGAMAWAVSTSRVRLSRSDRELLFCLRDTRNALAHLRPLDDEDLDRVAALVPDLTW
ncbi:hypothetical protein ABTZ99_11975 [Actinosynnema sp. NPDC002837]